MASDNIPAGPNVPGFRKQAKTVAATVLEREKRERLTAEVTRYATELAGFTKEHVTDAEKRSALLRYAKGLPRQAVTTAKDPAARATLLDKLRTTMTTLQQAIKDPTKRQELHDSLAATTHNLMTSSGLVSPGPVASGLVPSSPASGLVSPGPVSPGLMPPGLASAGLALPGLGSSGLVSPGPVSSSLASPGPIPPDLASSDPESVDLASSGPVSSGLMSPSLESPGLASPGLESPDLAPPGLESPGLESPGLAPPALVSSARVSPGLLLPDQESPGLTLPGSASSGLASSAPASPDLASRIPAPPGPVSSRQGPFGLVSSGLATTGLASTGVMSPDPASPGPTSPGLESLDPATPGLVSSDLASPGLTLPGSASLDLASPGPLSLGPVSSGLVSPDSASLGLASAGPLSAGPNRPAPDLATPGLLSSGPDSSDLASSGPVTSDLASSALASGPASPAVASSDLASSGPATSAAVSAVLASGPAPSAMTSSDLASSGLATPALASSALASGLASPAVASSDLASSGPAASAAASSALSSAGLALARLVSPGRTSLDLASPGLTPPATPNAFEGAASTPGPVPPPSTARRVTSPPAAARMPSSPAARRMPPFPVARRIPSPHPTVNKVLSPTTAGQVPSPLTPRQRGQPFFVCSDTLHPQQQQPLQQQQPKKQACKVFISHSRERKSILASSLHTILFQAAGVSTYLDERGLIPGTVNAATMEYELRNAPVVVLLLSKDYMCKKGPMWELDIALKRRSTPSSPVKVIPVLVDISIEELGDLSSQVYHHRSWIRSTGCTKPTDEDLQQWAALGSEVARLACINKDQGLSSCWSGDLQQLVMGECIAALKQMKLLPRDYTLRDPRRLPMFVSKPDNVLLGRATELESMRRGLLQQKRLVVTGGPGEGKTALARSVAGQLYNDGCFPAGAFEVDMTGVAGDEREAVASLLVPYLKQALGNSIAADDPPNWKTLERWLQMNNQPWVLLLDNTEELVKQYKGSKKAQLVLDTLAASLFGASRGALHLIVVSRTATLTLPQAAVFQLQQLPEGDATALLRSYCPRVILTDIQAADVTKACGCNPLELQLIGGLLNHHRVTPKAVVAKGRTARLLADTMVGDPFTECTERLVQWWKLILGPAMEDTPSWHLFSKRRQPLLAVAALATFAGSFSADSAVAVAGAVCSHSVALADLKDLGVLQDVSCANSLSGRYEMHRLHREAACHLLREAPDQQQAAAHAFIRCTLQIAQQLKKLHKELITTNGGSTSGITTARKQDMLLCLPVAEASNITHMLGSLEQLATLSPSNHSVAPGWQQQVASGLVDLARQLYLVAQHHMAEPLYQRALAIREQVLGPKHPDTASVLNNLALLLKAQGKLAEAELLYRRNLAINEEVLGSEHADTATSLNNLAQLLQDQGKLAEAEMLYRRALAIREDVLGPEHPDTASTLNNLAGLLQDEGKLAEAEPLCKRALAICEEVVGPEHPHTACSLNNLALLLEAQGKLAEAEPLYKRALAICEEALGPKHPHTAISVNNVALVLWAQGKLAEAKPMCKRALAIREEVLGPNHPDTVTTRSNLTRLMQNRGLLAR